MAGSEKICLFCQRDCSDRDRVVDDRGRYACRVCLAAAKRIRAESMESLAARTDAPGETDLGSSDDDPANGSEPVAEPVAEAGSETGAGRESPGLMESRVLEPVPTPTTDSGSSRDQSDGTGTFSLPSTEICPTCGGDVMPFNVLCLECGTDLTTGERVRAATADDGDADGVETGDDETDGDAGPEGAEPDDAEIETGTDRDAVRAARAPMNIPAWPATGFLAAAVGAAAWVFIRASTGQEIDVLAWGVGLGAGLGVYIWSDQRGDATTGLYAVLVAFVCIAGGKLGGGAIAAQQLREATAVYEPEHKAMARLADEIAHEWETEQGRELGWPRWVNAQKAARDFRYWPFGYPASVEEEVGFRWEGLSPAQRQTRFDDVEAEATTVGVLSADLALNDLFWSGLALLTAYQFGAGGFSRVVAAGRTLLADGPA